MNPLDFDEDTDGFEFYVRWILSDRLEELQFGLEDDFESLADNIKESEDVYMRANGLKELIPSMKEGLKYVDDYLVSGLSPFVFDKTTNQDAETLAINEKMFISCLDVLLDETKCKRDTEEEKNMTNEAIADAIMEVFGRFDVEFTNGYSGLKMKLKLKGII